MSAEKTTNASYLSEAVVGKESREAILRFTSRCRELEGSAPANVMPRDYAYVWHLFLVEQCLEEKNYFEACSHLADVVWYGCSEDGTASKGLLANIFYALRKDAA